MFPQIDRCDAIYFSRRLTTQGSAYCFILGNFTHASERRFCAGGQPQRHYFFLQGRLSDSIVREREGVRVRPQQLDGPYQLLSELISPTLSGSRYLRESPCGGPVRSAPCVAAGRSIDWATRNGRSVKRERYVHFSNGSAKNKKNHMKIPRRLEYFSRLLAVNLAQFRKSRFLHQPQLEPRHGKADG